jgi:hypothetical protein
MDQPARSGASKTATRHGSRAPPGAIVSKLGLARPPDKAPRRWLREPD